MQQNQSQNPMAVEPVPKLMARIGLPIVLSMILQAAYNVVDSAYLAAWQRRRNRPDCLEPGFPVQLFMVAVSIGTGVGTNALLALPVGPGRPRTVPMPPWAMRSFWRWSTRRCYVVLRRWGWCLTSTPKARAAASAARC